MPQHRNRWTDPVSWIPNCCCKRKGIYGLHKAWYQQVGLHFLDKGIGIKGREAQGGREGVCGGEVEPVEFNLIHPVCCTYFSSTLSLKPPPAFPHFICRLLAILSMRVDWLEAYTHPHSFSQCVSVSISLQAQLRAPSSRLQMTDFSTPRVRHTDLSTIKNHSTQH